MLVTGAGGDIGAQIVHQLLHLGAHVSAMDRDAGALETLTATSRCPERLTCLVADVTDDARMAEAFSALPLPLDGLVNGAGIENRPCPIDMLDSGIFRTVMDINVTGMFLGLKFGIPLLRERGGAIVNLASTAGIKGTGGMSAYVASKHAVIGLTRCAAIEAGPLGIRVNAICPGPVEGRMIDSIMDSRPGAPSAAAQARMAAIPSRRFGRPEEIAKVTAFLLSDASTFVNGACYSVDGGISAL